MTEKENVTISFRFTKTITEKLPRGKERADFIREAVEDKLARSEENQGIRVAQELRRVEDGIEALKSEPLYQEATTRSAIIDDPDVKGQYDLYEQALTADEKYEEYEDREQD